MNSHLKDSDDEEIRTTIISAAQSRFHTYGPGKTTMVEIANDIDMSASNLYRYFKNKQELAEECAWKIIQAHLNELEYIVQQHSVMIVSRLQEFMQIICEHKYSHSEKDPRFHDLIEYVNCHDPKLMLRQMKAEQDIINELLCLGKASGEFVIKDTMLTARIIHTAIVYYDSPDISGFYSKEQITEMVQQSVEILLYGIISR